LPDQRVPPGRMTWTRFSARTGIRRVTSPVRRTPRSPLAPRPR
jgi:hypothetical protein